MSSEEQAVLNLLMQIGEDVADEVVNALRTEGIVKCSSVHELSESDVIYEIDRVAEEVIIRLLEEQAAGLGGIVLVAEGIGESDLSVYPQGSSLEEAKWRILMDPIDGTRGLMYDKRAAFFLAGAALNKGVDTRLSDIQVAVMCEIPTTRMFLCDTLSAVRGSGIRASRRNLITVEREGYIPKPSAASTIRGGFAQFARFFSPGKDILARLEEELLAELFPDARDKEIVAFEDQYISSGGQLYELLTGKDRFVGDVRRSLYENYKQSLRGGHVCHPYDLAAHLIGEEAGVIITGIDGGPLDGPFETVYPMDWIGFANQSIYKEVSPVLRGLLHRFKLV